MLSVLPFCVMVAVPEVTTPPVGKVLTGGAAASAGTFHAAQIAAAVMEIRSELPNIARQERRNKLLNKVGTALRARQRIVRRRLPTRIVNDGGSNSMRTAPSPTAVFWSGLVMSEPQCRAYMRVQVTTFFRQGCAGNGDPRHIQFHVEVATQRIARAEAQAGHGHAGRDAAAADVIVVTAADIVKAQQAQVALADQFRRIDFGIDDHAAVG